MLPKISVIIPVKNCEETIQKSIESVLSQTFSNFEVIIIDNNCNDSTIEIVKKIKDNRIKIVECLSTGIVPALNTGLMKAKGEFIARQDGDDVWYPKKLETQLEVFNSNPNIDICGTQIRMVSKDGKILDDNFRYPITDNIIKSWLLTGKNSIAHPSVLFRKSICLRVGGYDDTYPIAEDHHLWLRCVRWFNFINLSEVMVDYMSNHNPEYDSKIPLLASEAQFKVLKHMEIVKVC
tara:strand:- start:298 stop:1005 length:708 start_codon:yes stop_codon:yes gene_type:complete